MDAAEDNDLCIRRLCPPGQPQGITQEIGYALDLVALVVVDENDRATLPSELLDFG